MPSETPDSGFHVFLLPKRGQRLTLTPEHRENTQNLRRAVGDVMGWVTQPTTTHGPHWHWQPGYSDTRFAGHLALVTDRVHMLLAERAFRVISAPTEPTKRRQRVLADRLSRIPAHRRAFGFIRGRGPLDCARAHCLFHGESPRGLLLLNVDVKDFFHSVSDRLVRSALIGHGMGEGEAEQIIDQCTLRADGATVAELLSAFSRHFNPEQNQEVVKANLANFLGWRDDTGRMSRLRLLLLQQLMGTGPAVEHGGRFLPQGAPTSPVLANLSCKLLDIRLEALATSMGAFYTRYADDLVFSWRRPDNGGHVKGRVVDGLLRASTGIAREYGLHFNPKKIRVIGPGKPQDVVGYLVNAGTPTVPPEFRHGVDRELRGLSRVRRHVVTDQQLARVGGLIGHVASAHPEQAARLRQRLGALRDTPVRQARMAPAHAEIEVDAPVYARMIRATVP